MRYSIRFLLAIALLTALEVHGQSIITVEYWPLLDSNSRAMWSAGFLDGSYVRYSQNVEQGTAEQRAVALSLVRCLGKVTPKYFTIMRDALRERRNLDEDMRILALADLALTEWCLL